MAQSLAHILVHIIFSTKNRSALLQPPDLRSQVHAYLTATSKALGCEPLSVGGPADHVHILVALSRKTSVADLVKNLKISSTKVVRDKGHGCFGWQTGYAAFSVCQSGKEAVIAYIAKQESHHRSISFQEEVRMFLEKHSIPFDERYLWD